MRRCTLVAAAAALVVLATGALPLGRLLASAWQLGRLESESAAEREDAARWFAEHPSSRAVPRLVELELERSTSSPQALDASSRDSVWLRAIEACGGRAAAPLFRLYRERPELSEALAAIVDRLDVDAGSWSVWTEALEDPVLARFSDAAAYGLAGLGVSGQPAIERLVGVLRGGDDLGRRNALVALRGIAPDAAALEGTLEEALADPCQGVRLEAAFCAGHWKVRSREVSAALERLRSGGDDEERAAADWALYRIREEEEP